MNKLKILIVILIAFIISITGLFPKNFTFANAEYLRVIDQTTLFYSEDNGNKPLFYIPYTYYVKVLNKGEVYTHVEFGGNGEVIDGYVLTGSLFEDGLEVISPYPQISITTASQTILYYDVSLQTTVQHVFLGRTLNLFGKYLTESGDVIYYVEYNGKLGYVLENDIIPFEVPFHPNELTFISPPENPENSQPLTANLDSLRIIIILCLILAGLIGLTIALKTHVPKNKGVGFYDENDYE